MIFWLYNILLVLLSPIWVLWMVWRARKRREQPDWQQRCGNLPVTPPAASTRRLWLHAVSVGEVMAALPVLKEVRRLDPALEIVLSTTTSSGQATASEKAVGLYDHLVYFPIDVPRFVVAAMMRVRPKVVAVMETELWMNFLWAAKQFGARTILINGRIGDKSYFASNLGKYFYRALFKHLDHALVQSETDARRISNLGYPSPVVVGNTKFDGAIADAQVERNWRAELEIPPDALVVVIGSTRSELEESMVLDALASVDSDPWVVHAPRHIERADALAEAYRARFGSVALRSLGETGKHLILDTYGELAGVYSVATVAVVGGGFDSLGGQNIIQPLAHGIPVIHGPHMRNFRDIADAASRTGASLVVHDSEGLAKWLNKLLSDPEDRVARGKKALDLLQKSLGASLRYAEAIVAAATD